jgi:hypothetical protein
MKLLWLVPLFARKSDDHAPVEELDWVPRSERFPSYPHHSDMPVDPIAMAERDRIRYLSLYY